MSIYQTCVLLDIRVLLIAFSLRLLLSIISRNVLRFVIYFVLIRERLGGLTEKINSLVFPIGMQIMSFFTPSILLCGVDLSPRLQFKRVNTHKTHHFDLFRAAVRALKLNNTCVKIHNTVSQWNPFLVDIYTSPINILTVYDITGLYFPCLHCPDLTLQILWFISSVPEKYEAASLCWTLTSVLCVPVLYNVFCVVYNVRVDRQASIQQRLISIAADTHT